MDAIVTLTGSLNTVIASLVQLGAKVLHWSHMCYKVKVHIVPIVLWNLNLILGPSLQISNHKNNLLHVYSEYIK